MKLSRLVALAALSLQVSLALTSASFGLTYSKDPNEGDDENSVLAIGNVEIDEAFRFQTYLSKLPPKPRTSLHLDSTGGSVQGAVAMGRVVNEVKIRTFVDGTNAKCNSACVNIFLAGRDRESGRPYRVKGSANRLGFHNFVPVLQDKQYAQKDAVDVMARAQKTIYDLALYFQDVDADLELLGLGLKQKDIYSLPNQDALRYGIHVLDTTSKELIRSDSYMRFVKP